MAAGHAGLSEVFTPEAAIALNNKGDELRQRLNDLARQHNAAVQFTGCNTSGLKLQISRHLSLDPVIAGDPYNI